MTSTNIGSREAFQAKLGFAYLRVFLKMEAVQIKLIQFVKFSIPALGNIRSRGAFEAKVEGVSPKFS